MILKPTPIRTNEYLISYYKPDNLLIAEDSSLPRPSLVWDDACDVGYTVISHRTGREVIYALHSQESRKGDLLYWDYRPISRRDSGLPTLRVFND